MKEPIQSKKTQFISGSGYCQPSYVSHKTISKNGTSGRAHIGNSRVQVVMFLESRGRRRSRRRFEVGETFSSQYLRCEEYDRVF
jgi:hypothetical protein